MEDNSLKILCFIYNIKPRLRTNTTWVQKKKRKLHFSSIIKYLMQLVPETPTRCTVRQQIM